MKVLCPNCLALNPSINEFCHNCDYSLGYEFEIIVDNKTNAETENNLKINLDKKSEIE